MKRDPKAESLRLHRARRAAERAQLDGALSDADVALQQCRAACLGALLTLRRAPQDATRRLVEGRRFVRASGNRSAEAWQVESVSPVSSVSSAPGAKSVSGNADDSNAYACASRGE